MNIEYSFWTTVSDKSPMKVLFELVRKSEGILQRIEETQNGFVLAISVAGQANSGAIYIYDRLCGALFMLVVVRPLPLLHDNHVGHRQPGGATNSSWRNPTEKGCT